MSRSKHAVAFALVLAIPAAAQTFHLERDLNLVRRVSDGRPLQK